MRIYNLLSLALIVLFVYCKQNERVQSTVEISDTIEKQTSINQSSQNPYDEEFQKSQVEIFDTFLQEFIKDSIFRYKRIKFPMLGYNSDADKNVDNYYWSKEDWDFYFYEDIRFKENENIISNISIEDSIATWRLYIPNSGYDINYYFSLQNAKWYLKSYSYKNY